MSDTNAKALVNREDVERPIIQSQYALSVVTEGAPDLQFIYQQRT